jgi:hypothetical protein
LRISADSYPTSHCRATGAVHPSAPGHGPSVQQMEGDERWKESGGFIAGLWINTD